MSRRKSATVHRHGTTNNIYRQGAKDDNGMQPPMNADSRR
jgi:hypothetical protein